MAAASSRLRSCATWRVFVLSSVRSVSVAWRCCVCSGVGCRVCSTAASPSRRILFARCRVAWLAPASRPRLALVSRPSVNLGRPASSLFMASRSARAVWGDTSLSGWSRSSLSEHDLDVVEFALELSFAVRCQFRSVKQGQQGVFLAAPDRQVLGVDDAVGAAGRLTSVDQRASVLGRNDGVFQAFGVGEPARTACSYATTLPTHAQRRRLGRL